MKAFHEAGAGVRNRRFWIEEWLLNPTFLYFREKSFIIIDFKRSLIRTKKLIWSKLSKIF